MAWTELYTGTEAVGATEHSVTTDTAGPDADTTNGTFMLVLDVSDMVAGDILKVRAYEKARSGDTQRLLDTWTVVPFGSALVATPAIMFKHGWDFTLQAAAGTITVLWSVRQL